MFKNTAAILSIRLRKARGRSSRSRNPRRALSCLVLFSLFAIVTTPSPAQTFTSLFSFNGTNGQAPDYGYLTQGIDGRFYGTTAAGGSNAGGTVFKITPQGALTTIYNFCSQPNCADGKEPLSGVVLGTDGNFYGTASAGGASGDGTVFQITSSGVLTTLHSFNGTDGMSPAAQLTQGTDGEFYGSTQDGGMNRGDGTIFKITSEGSLLTIATFYDSNKQGSNPFSALVQGDDGDFYGLTPKRELRCCGAFFKVTPGGTLTTLALMETVGKYPYDPPVLAADGNFYAVTSGGQRAGTFFQATASGSLTLLYSFGSDGRDPIGGLVQATDGNFYGTTYGSSGCKGEGLIQCGTILELTSDGSSTLLHNFDITDGSHPVGGLIQATDGNFYGTTTTGGTDNDGTIFSLATGLGPFVKSLPTAGAVGKAVTILGTNLTGTTTVSFNGTAATFTASGSAINTTVPAGATTGTIKVTTPTGTLSSNVVFTVTP
jgi:uncharacterized repeat protein (TIGR03803 family)